MVVNKCHHPCMLWDISPPTPVLWGSGNQLYSRTCMECACCLQHLTITAASGEKAIGTNCPTTARAQNLIRSHAFLQLWPKTFVPLFYNRTVEMATSGDIIRKKYKKINTHSEKIFFFRMLMSYWHGIPKYIFNIQQFLIKNNVHLYLRLVLEGLFILIVAFSKYKCRFFTFGLPKIETLYWISVWIHITITFSKANRFIILLQVHN